jgi:hypothetical protein
MKTIWLIKNHKEFYETKSTQYFDVYMYRDAAGFFWSPSRRYAVEYPSKRDAFDFVRTLRLYGVTSVFVVRVTTKKTRKK